MDEFLVIVSKCALRLFSLVDVCHPLASSLVVAGTPDTAAAPAFVAGQFLVAYEVAAHPFDNGLSVRKRWRMGPLPAGAEPLAELLALRQSLVVQPSEDVWAGTHGLVLDGDVATAATVDDDAPVVALEVGLEFMALSRDPGASGTGDWKGRSVLAHILRCPAASGVVLGCARACSGGLDPGTSS